MVTYDSHYVMILIWFDLLILFQEHYNYYGTDRNLGPLIMSIRYEKDSAQEYIRVILR